jgi:group I intron endonuclease
MYVGYTSKHYTVRWKEHINASKYNSKKVLYKAFRKYGIENFEFRPVSTARTHEQAKLFEQRTIHTLDTFNSGYNRTVGGDGSGFHTEEHKKYMSELMKKRKFSDETRYKMSISAKNKPKSEEFKQRVSDKLKNDPEIKTRNKISGIYSHYKRGHKISNENMILIEHLIERDRHEHQESFSS